MPARMIRFWTLMAALGSGIIPAHPEPVTVDRISYRNLRLYVQGPVPWLTAQDMNGDGLADLVVQNGRSIEVYLQDARTGITPTPKAVLPLPERTFVYDVGVRAKGAETGVVAVHPDGVEWYGYRNDAFVAPEPWLEFPTLFRGTCTGNPVRAGLLFDMEGDGDSDLVLPDRDGFLIFVAGESGFALSQRLAAETSVLLAPYGRSIQDPMQASLTLPSFHFGDVNGDARLDLLLEGFYSFDIYYQDTQGRYDAKPSVTVSVNAAGVKKKSGRRYFMYEVPPKVTDLNADGYVDAVATFPSKGVTGIYLGKAAGSQVFETPDQVIRFDGWTLAHVLQDVNGDQRKDLILAKMEKVGFWGGLQILITRTIDVDILAYLEAPDGRYPESPSFQKTIEVPLILSASHQMLKIETPHLLNFAGDFNRDGRKDMLFKSAPDRLTVNFGTSEGVFTEDDPLEIATVDTSAFSSSQPTVADINGDGLSDLVLYHRDFTSEKHLIEVLLSKTD